MPDFVHERERGESERERRMKGSSREEGETESNQDLLEFFTVTVFDRAPVQMTAVLRWSVLIGWFNYIDKTSCYNIQTIHVWVQCRLLWRRSVNLWTLAANQTGGPDVNLHRRNQQMDGWPAIVSNWIRPRRTYLDRIFSAVEALSTQCPDGELQAASWSCGHWTQHTWSWSWRYMIDNDLSLKCLINHVPRTCRPTFVSPASIILQSAVHLYRWYSS